MKEKENYRYKKFFREIYLACLGMGRKSISIKGKITDEKLFESKWLLPFFYKIFISPKDSEDDKKLIQEIEDEFFTRFSDTELQHFILDKAYGTFCGYRGLVKYILLLFVLFDFITRIRKSDEKSSCFLPMIKSSVEDKIKILGLSREEREGLYEYRTMDYFEDKLDWNDITNDENFLRFHELKEDTVRSGPFRTYYFNLKEGADNIIANIKEFDGDDFTSYYSSLTGDIELEAKVFLEDTFIENELAKARNYYEHKNRSPFVNEKIRSVVGGIFRDIAMDEMNLK